VAVDSSGTVYFADSDNNLIRKIASGAVTTIAGNGNQGDTGDTGAATSASLDTPDSVALFGGTVALADTNNQAVRLVTSGGIDTSAGQSNSAESLLLSGTASITYGTGVVTATFTNGGKTATGSCNFLDGLGSSPTPLGAVAFATNSAQFNTSALSAGTHDLVAAYAGDSNNAATASAVFVLTIAPAPASATANGAAMEYGQTVPALSGTLNGILSQDSGKVSAQYTTTATATSTPGTYPIAIALTGSAAGNYTLTVGAGSGSVIIGKAPSTISLSASSASPSFGATETLTATVASTTSGSPTGTVSFYDGATLLNATGAAVNASGVATLALTTLAVGAHSITAVYSGDTDFLASTSSAVIPTVISQDFSIAATPSSQSVLPGQSASYTLTLTPANPTFASPVAFTASGLPDGVTASFNPPAIAAGSAASSTTMTLAASAQAQLPRAPAGVFRGSMGASALALLLFPVAFSRRMRRVSKRLSTAARLLLVILALALSGALTACGGGGFFTHATTSYTVAVTATSGSVSHTANVTLTVQ